MISVSDIIRLLEQIPIWKRLSAMPAQIEDLQRRVAALEAAQAARPKANLCPICQRGELRVVAVKPDPIFGDVGLQRRVLRCSEASCGHTEERQYDPNKDD